LEAETGSWRTTTVETERILQEIQVILTSEAPLTTKRTDFARNPSNFNFAGRESISTIKSILAIPERPENSIIKLRNNERITQEIQVINHNFQAANERIAQEIQVINIIGGRGGSAIEITKSK
jgi:hypothetical protein